jgi:hypothetical protein
MKTMKLNWPDIVRSEDYIFEDIEKSKEILINMYDFGLNEINYEENLFDFFSARAGNKKIILLNVKDKYKEMFEKKSNVSILKK